MVNLFGEDTTPYKNRIAELEKVVEALKTWKAAYQELEPKYKQLQKEAAAARSEVTAWRSECAQLGSTIKKYEKEKSKVDAIIEEKESKLQEAIELLRELQEERDNHKAELQNLIQELTEAQAQLTEAYAEINCLSKNVSWVKLGEAGDEVGYRGYHQTGEIIQPAIIRIKKQHLQEIPIEVKAGEEIFSDGGHYPISLLDYIRTGKSSFVINHPVTTAQSANSGDNNIKVPSEPGEQLSPNQEKVLDYIEQYPNLTQKDIAEGLDLDKSTVSKAVASLEESGLIEQDNNGGYQVS